MKDEAEPISKVWTTLGTAVQLLCSITKVSSWILSCPVLKSSHQTHPLTWLMYWIHHFWKLKEINDWAVLMMEMLILVPLSINWAWEALQTTWISEIKLKTCINSLLVARPCSKPQAQTIWIHQTKLEVVKDQTAKQQVSPPHQTTNPWTKWATWTLTQVASATALPNNTQTTLRQATKTS